MAREDDDAAGSGDSVAGTPRRPGAVLGLAGPGPDGVPVEPAPPPAGPRPGGESFAGLRRIATPRSAFANDPFAPRRRVPHDLVDLIDAPQASAPGSGHALAALAPRATPTLCSADDYEVLLAAYRRWVTATAIVAIASSWDSGRISYPSPAMTPFESEVFGLAGRRTGLAQPQLLEALLALHEATELLDAARSALAGQRSPFDVLCADHGIGKTGALVLLFVVAPALWGEIARIFGILVNDPARAACDPHLLVMLLGDITSRRELARELDPDSPLVRQGILRLEAGCGSFQGIAVDPCVVKLLAGSPVDADVEPGVTLVPATVPLRRFMTRAEVIDQALADLSVAPAGLGRLVVRGGGGRGRRTLLATLAQLAGRTLAVIDGASLIREDRLGALPRMLQRAHLRGWLPCIDGLDLITSDDHPKRGAVRDALRGHAGPLAMRLAWHVTPPLDPGYVQIDLPISSIGERTEQWTQLAAAAGLVIDEPQELATRFTVGPGTIRKVVSAVARAAPWDTDHAIDTELRQHLQIALGTVATRVTRLARWSQMVLPAAIADSVAELIARVRHRRTVYDLWGFDAAMAARGIAVLLQGSPGTGKTLLASALASELGLDLYRVDLAGVMSKWIGETEQNLARVFDAAEQGQAIILFDEADALFGRRTEVRTSIDRYANLEVNYLLQRLDAFDGVAILTTNLGTAIDPAFQRRMTFRLTLPFPDAAARERLWRVHLPSTMPMAAGIDLGGLARRYEMSGGFIRNAALRAAFLAAQDQSSLTQLHLERAIRAEFRDGGKLEKSGVLE